MAAVLFVILYVPLVFRAAVVFPLGVSSGVDWFAAVTRVAAFPWLDLFMADVL